MTKTDKTLKLMGDIVEVSTRLAYHADNAENDYDVALREYQALSQEEYFLGLGISEEEELETLAEDFEFTVNSADKFLNWTRENIQKFDKQLAKIIELRGRLAEETGIPMMSHLGTEGFGRESAEFVM